MWIKVYHQNVRAMERLWDSITGVPRNVFTGLVCTPTVQSIDVSNVPIGGMSEPFVLGQCTTTQWENEPLWETQNITVVFTASLSLDREVD
jgi:hypothetical protein